MGLKVGNYAKIWSHEDKGRYAVVEMTTSKRDKETGDFKTDFASKYVRFIGSAHDKLANLQENGRIRITDCEVTIEKGNDGKYYTSFLVYNFENADAPKTADDAEASTPRPATAKKTETPKRQYDEIPDAGDDDIPF